VHHRGNTLVLHDELSEVNEPIYFYQFAEQAARHGLQYLGEADFNKMLSTQYPAKVSKTLVDMSESVIDLEQYMDFLRNRTFRQTLLCHDSFTLRRSLGADQLRSFLFSSFTEPDPDPKEVHSVKVATFEGSDGSKISTDHPVSKEALRYLAERWPRPVSFETLLSVARDRVRKQPGVDVEDERVDSQVVSANIVKAYGYSGSLIEFHTYDPGLVLEVSERPVVSPVARLQSRDNATVTNLRHERVDLDPLDRALLPYLDGEHDLAGIAEGLIAGPVANGDIQVTDHEGEEAARSIEAFEDRDRVRDIVVRDVNRRLPWLARASLLVG